MDGDSQEYGKTAFPIFRLEESSRKIYCVMIWDTQSREIVGTDCYAVLNLPTQGPSHASIHTLPNTWATFEA